jgi:magnesium chelatase subunit I
VADTAKGRFAGLDLRPLVDAVVDGHLVATGERVPGHEVLQALPELPVLHEVAARLDVEPTDPPGRIAAAVELALESLYLRRKLAKDSDSSDGSAVYGP